MAKSDFTFVGSPHDPVSISGSDPHTGSHPGIPYLAGQGARLALWQKIEPGWMLTGSGLFNTNHGPGNNRIYALYDASGNPESKDRDRIGRHMRVVGNNNYNHVNQPCISASMVNKGYIQGDNQFFLMNRTSQTNGEILLANRYQAADHDLDVDNSTNYNWTSTWVSGSQDNDSTGNDADEATWEGYTHFAVMKSNNNADGTTDRPFIVHYGAARNDTNLGSSNHKTYSVGIRKGTGITGGDSNELCIFWNDKTDDGSEFLQSGEATLGPGFHQLTGWMRRDPQAGNLGQTKIELFHQGLKSAERTIVADAGDLPILQGRYRMASIGGVNSTSGGGYHGNPDIAGGIDETQPNNAGFNGLAEWCVFDNALSVQRRQQIEKYLCDKYGLEMSGSDYLSQMEGGAEGSAVLHSSLSNPLTGNGTYAREYRQAATSSADFLIQHETVGGGFLKSTAGSGNFYNVQSESGISLRLHVRAANLNDANHDGSQVALVAKATSPFGNQVDHIKGYALKFGTLKDGSDQGDTPKFRLSLRNGDQYLDGLTSESCGDIDMSSSILGETFAADTWYTMRLDVIPSGHNFDRIRAYASTDGGATYHELSASGASPLAQGEFPTAQDISRTSKRYRYWKDDNKFNEKRVPIQNGTHNGYYVALSSSSGHTTGTKYYIDGFTAKLDTV